MSDALSLERNKHVSGLRLGKNCRQHVHDDDEKQGEGGSPSRNPFACQKGSSAVPLIRTLVLAIENSRASRTSHDVPKPRLHKTSSKKGHEIESNALAMSSFSITASTRRRCRERIDCWTSMKLSEMARPPMNAL